MYQDRIWSCEWDIELEVNGVTWFGVGVLVVKLLMNSSSCTLMNRGDIMKCLDHIMLPIVQNKQKNFIETSASDCNINVA